MHIAADGDTDLTFCGIKMVCLSPPVTEDYYWTWNPHSSLVKEWGTYKDKPIQEVATCDACLLLCFLEQPSQ